MTHKSEWFQILELFQLLPIFPVNTVVSSQLLLFEAIQHAISCMEIPYKDKFSTLKSSVEWIKNVKIFHMEKDQK